MIPKRFSRILVDLDGTLANNMPSIYLGYKRFLAHYEIIGTEKEFYELVGPPLRQAVEILKERYKIKPPLDELAKEYEEFLQEGYRCSYEMHTDADTFLEWAHREGIPIVLATAAPKRLAMEFIRRYDLQRFFERIVTAEDSDFTKVEPDYFLQLTDDPQNTLMIDDSLPVIAAAKMAGLQTHLIRNDWKQLLESFAIRFNETKVQPNFTVEVITGIYKEPLDEKTRIQVDAIWEEECKKYGDKLFNGQILSHISTTSSRLIGEFVEYKHFLVQEMCPELRPILKVQPVGLTAFVTNGSHVLIGERSSEVATHQHFYELVPSGGVDATYYHNGKVDMEKLVLSELKEEAGIKASLVETLRPTHVVHDPATDAYEICFMLTVKSVLDVSTIGEHSELLWLPFDKAKQFADKNPFVPLSEYVLLKVLDAEGL